jgi:hypothetical protein
MGLGAAGRGWAGTVAGGDEPELPMLAGGEHRYLGRSIVPRATARA